MFTVILDAGHGNNTPGKCSPLIDFEYDKNFTSIENNHFREYRFTRRVVKAAIPKLKEKGFNVIELVPEEKDISLATRVNRINALCKKYGASNCCMVSTHVNAAGSAGKWMTGRGWSVWTTKGVTVSDKLATCFHDSAKENIGKDTVYTSTFNGQKIQKPIRVDFSDGDADYEANFYIIKGANCAAILVENLFQDNKEDVKYLESKNGFNRIVNTLVDGVVNYAKKYNKN